MCTSLVTPKGATYPNNGEQTVWQKEPISLASHVVYEDWPV